MGCARSWIAITGGIAALLSVGFLGQAGQEPPESKADNSKRAAPQKLDQAALEKQFQRSLTDVVLRGSWRMTRGAGLKGEAPLGKPRPEKYTIVSANKADGDWWLIRARIEYADNDVELPIRVRVVWAGDTPVITVDDIGFPGLGTYSARVMMFRGFYSGTWFGSGYGGVMSGQILTPAQALEAEKASLVPLPDKQPG